MKYLNPQQKAEKMITYAIAEASTLSDAADAFNNCADCIKTKTFAQLCVDIDNYLA